jgi:hypothetical protein
LFPARPRLQEKRKPDWAQLKATVRAQLPPLFQCKHTKKATARKVFPTLEVEYSMNAVLRISRLHVQAVFLSKLKERREAQPQGFILYHAAGLPRQVMKALG